MTSHVTSDALPGAPNAGARLLAVPQALALLLILALAGAGVVTGRSEVVGASVCLGVVCVATFFLTSWRALLSLLFFVILFIPIKFYEFPINLPFDLEPYRVLVAILVIIWIGALLVDPHTRLRRTPIDPPIIVLFLVWMVSISVNINFIYEDGLTGSVVKSVSFYLSFLVSYALICSVTRSLRDLELFLRVLVGGGGVVGFFAAIQYNTGYNIFDHLHVVFPFLRFEGLGALADITRDDRMRVWASAQHPIALAAAMVMLLPLGVYLGLSTRRLRWWVATFLIGVGALTTLSRTGITMFVAAAIMFWICRPVDMRRLLPLLVPGFIAVFLLLPQALGSLESSFFPTGGLVAEQNGVGSAGNGTKDGRLATLGPGLRQWETHPIVGQGLGTRMTASSNANSDINDDQWLDSLIETGVVGVGVFGWLFVRSTRRLKRVARQLDSNEGILAGAIAASIVSFAVGMLTFDAFSFIQATFLFFIITALGAALLAVVEGHGESARGVSAVSDLRANDGPRIAAGERWPESRKAT